MEIRAARESELEQVVELNCQAFNPNQHERYWQYLLGDSSYRLAQTRVVVVNDMVVSTLRVWERRIRIGASLVTMGGIGGVCTHEKHQGVGYASALMRQTIDYLKKAGCDIGVLFTIIPESFYHRLGWTSLPLHGFQIKCHSATLAVSQSDLQVRTFNLETDLDTVASIHDLSNAAQSGTLSRTRAYWDMEPSRIRGILPTVIAHRNGDLCGYLNYNIHEKSVEVLEVGYKPDTPEVLDTLVSQLGQVCESEQIEEISGIFSPKHPFVAQLISRCKGEVTKLTDTTMMLYAVCLPTLLRRLVVRLEAVIAEAEQSFPSLAVEFPVVNKQQAVMRYDGNATIQIVNDAQDADHLEMSEEDFWQLLFGEIGWEEIKSDVSVSDEVSEFLNVLFPKRDVLFWYPDRY